MMANVETGLLTLTEAQIKRGIDVVMLTRDVTQSSARNIPYSELYSGRTGLMETPIEYLQRAAEDEEQRGSAR